jgi:hypothetical protein
MSDEDLAIRHVRATVAQVLREAVADGIGQREPQRSRSLALVHTQSLGAPLDGLQSQSDHLTGSKAVGSDEQQHRVVPQADRCRAVNRAEQGADGFPGQSAWKSFLPIKAGCVDLSVQPGGDQAMYSQEPQEGAKFRDNMLKPPSPHSPAGETDKVLYIP